MEKFNLFQQIEGMSISGSFEHVKHNINKSDKISNYGDVKTIIKKLTYDSDIYKNFDQYYLSLLTFEDFFLVEEMLSQIRNQDNEKIISYQDFDNLDDCDKKTIYTILCYNCSEETEVTSDDWSGERKAIREIANSGKMVDDNFVCNNCYDDMVNEKIQELQENLLEDFLKEKEQKEENSLKLIKPLSSEYFEIIYQAYS